MQKPSSFKLLGFYFLQGCFYKKIPYGSGSNIKFRQLKCLPFYRANIDEGYPKAS